MNPEYEQSHSNHVDRDRRVRAPGSLLGLDPRPDGAPVSARGPGKRGQHAGTSASLVIGLLIAIVVTGATACVPPDKTAWLRHIKAPTIVQAPTPHALLLAELQRSSLNSGSYMPAEQIAAYAVHELQQGNDWDAALFLSIASYRYHQQAILVLELASAQLYRINPQGKDLFNELVGNEAKFFNKQNFNEEIILMRDHLSGRSLASKRRQQYIKQLARGGREDDSLDQRLSDFQAEMSNRPERLAHPLLAEAFLERLRQDMTQGDFPFYYMAATPLDSFRLAAFEGAVKPFHPALVRNVVPRMKTLRSHVQALLHSPSANTRSNAAIVLGLSPDDRDIGLLELRLKQETHSNVIDSIRFALIRHGQHEHLESLLTRTRKAKKQDRDHALILIQWLPEKIQENLDERLFVRLAQSEGVSTMSRSIALIILRDIAHQRAIERASVAAILELVANQDEMIAEAAARAVKALDQLTAAECKNLYGQHQAARAALITRLSGIATLSDLEFLQRAFAASLEAEKLEKEWSGIGLRVAVASAVANIAGAAPRQLLERWFAEAADDDAMRWLLPTLLASRDDAAHVELKQGVSLGKRLLFSLAFDSPKQAAQVRDRLGDLDILDVVHLATLVGMLERHSLGGTMWRLASYRNDSYYPSDAVVRRLAMSSLIRMELARMSESTAEPVARQ